MTAEMNTSKIALFTMTLVMLNGCSPQQPSTVKPTANVQAAPGASGTILAIPAPKEESFTKEDLQRAFGAAFHLADEKPSADVVDGDETLTFEP